MRLVDMLKSLRKKSKVKKETKEIREPENKLGYLSENLAKTYDASDIELRPKKFFGFGIYYRETIGEEEYKIIKQSTNMEDNTDIIKYKWIVLPGGRLAFGGHLEITKPKEVTGDVYSLRDIWYKTMGEMISEGAKFTLDNLLSMKERIEALERIEPAYYDQLYEVKYRDSYEGERKFEGSKYFGKYSREITSELSDYVNFIGNEKLFIDIFGEDSENVITLSEKEFINKMHYSKNNSSDYPFEINLLADPGRSRLFNKYYFTKTALRQIPKDYEKGKGKKKEKGER